MNNRIQATFNRTFQKYDSKWIEVAAMGAAFIALNLILMLALGCYWINPSVHLYLSGKPL